MKKGTTQEWNPPAEKPSKTFKMTKILSDNIVELILLTIGLLFLIQPTIDNIKISFTLILISTFLVFLMTREHETTPDLQKKYSTKNPDYEKKLQRDSFRKKLQTMPQKIRSIPLSNRITIVLILWALLLFAFTKDIEVYFILIFIGIIITREITDLHTSNIYNKRLDVYIIIFLLIFIVLISQKIIEIVKV